MWVKTGTVAINGWQALRAHYLIVAMEMKDALADAEANLLVITKADVVAAKGVSVSGMTGVDIKVAVHAVFIAVPNQLCKRTSLGGKEKGGVFLAALTTPWTALLALARAACTAAIAAAAAAVAAADAAAIAAVADHQPPTEGAVASTGAAVAVDVDVMSKA